MLQASTTSYTHTLNEAAHVQHVYRVSLLQTINQRRYGTSSMQLTAVSKIKSLLGRPSEIMVCIAIHHLPSRNQA